MGVDNITLTADDGQHIGATVYAPEVPQAGVVVIGPAMGVPQQFYAPFAHWLASNGRTVVTFDYRGIGRSLSGKISDVEADIFDWARRDSSVALEHALHLASGDPVVWMGHSLGGQILPFIRNINSVSKIVTVASGTGYWLVNAKPLRYYVLMFWWLIVPLSLNLCGYFPGKRLRIIGDLPAGVMRQWRRWCLHREYSIGVEGDAVRAEYAAIRVPILSLSFDDDEMMSRESIDQLHGFYDGASITLQHVAAAEAPNSKIGHFGFFRPPIAERLWERYLLINL